MRTFGLIGYPLSHSFSEGYFKEKFRKEGITDAVYKPFPLEYIEDFESLLERQELDGLNVTIPYKEQVIPYLDELDEPVKTIEAVNTIKFLKAGDFPYLKGFNTDVYGFLESLRPLLQPYHKKALVLGTGGASKAVTYVLKQLGINWIYVSRNPGQKENTIAYQDIDEELMQSAHLIINTSPLGMYPHTDKAPDIPYELLSERHILYDLIYNPEITKFMELGKQQHARVKNGYEMLVLQAEKSWEIWNNPE